MRQELLGANRTYSATAPLIPLCGACGLYKTCSSPKMKPSGKYRDKILFVGESPGQEEDFKGEPFVGPSGRRLREAIKRARLDDTECLFTNSVICHPKGNQTENDHVDYCRANLLQTLRERNPEVVVLLGAKAVRSLVGALWKPNVGGIERWVGWHIPAHPPINAWVCPTYHPMYLTYENNPPALERLFDQHVKSAVDLLGSRPWKKAPQYEKRVRVMYDDRAKNALGLMAKGTRPVAVDYETDRLKPDADDSRIVCCAASNGNITIVYPWTTRTKEATGRLLASDVPKIASNCFSGDTKFLTRDHGVVSLEEMEGEYVSVLNHKGKWVPAHIRSFGCQETVETTFVRRNYQNTVRSTFDHQWISEETGDRISTKALRRRRYAKGKCIGPDRVPYLCAPKMIRNEDEYIQGIQHGIILGDGSKVGRRKNSFQARLCQEKKVLLSCFKGHSHWYGKNTNGDPIVYLTGKTKELKEVPSGDQLLSESYMIGFFRGLLATDGCVNHAGQVSITNERSVIEWCLKHLPRVGYWFQGVTNCNAYDGLYEGGYNHVQESRTVYLSRESVQEVDILRPSHLKKFRRVQLGPYKFSKLGGKRREKVYCAVVPSGHSFTLDGGLVTANCKFEERWSLKHFGVPVNNWHHDTMIAAHVLDNRPNVTSIKFQSFVLLGQPEYDAGVHPYLESSPADVARCGGNATNRVRQVDFHALATYCALDALLEWKVARIQRRQLGFNDI